MTQGPGISGCWVRHMRHTGFPGRRMPSRGGGLGRMPSGGGGLGRMPSGGGGLGSSRLPRILPSRHALVSLLASVY